MRQTRPTPRDSHDSTALGGITVTWSIQAEAYAREAARRLEVLAIAESQPAYTAMATLFFSAATRIRNERVERAA